MSDILKGETFVDGQSVNAARLNALVDNAEIQPESIGDKAVATPVNGDHVMIRQASSGLLKKATVAAISTAGGNVQSVGLDMPEDEFNVTGSPVTGTGTLAAAWKPFAQNKVLAAPEDGTSGVPEFRQLVVKDFDLASVVIAALAIDWNLSNTFSKVLTVNSTFTFTNIVNGRSIRVAITHSGFAAHWPGTVRWPDGTEPVSTPGGTNIFEFTVIGGVTFGWLVAENCHA